MQVVQEPFSVTQQSDAAKTPTSKMVATKNFIGTNVRETANWSAIVSWALGTADITARVAGALPGTWTYANGTLGVGATLTASATGTTTVDAVVLALNDIVLVNATTTGITNTGWGLYTVTTAGAVGVAAILTRHTSYDTAAELLPDILVAISAGTVAAGFQYLHHGAVIVLGTDPVLFTERGEPVGVVSFDVSNDSTNGVDGIWVPYTITLSTQPAATANKFGVSISDLGYVWIRAVYTATTGTGQLKITVVGKG